MALIDANQRRWEAMKFNTSRIPEFEAVAKKLIANKAQYQEISSEIFEQKNNTIPWAGIAVIDEREHDGPLGLCNSYLGNGQALGQVTTIVPKNRGPFLPHPTDAPLRGPFFRGALDALIDCAPHAADWHDWSPGGILTLLEQYNGLGYASRGLASPYIWGGTSEQQVGKFVSDGVFDANVMDTQLGCAGMLRMMSILDPTADYGPPGAPEPVPVPPLPDHPPPLSPTPPVTPMPTPVPAPAMNLAPIFTALWGLVPQLLPAIVPIIPSIIALTPLAPLGPIVQAGVNVFLKAQVAGGIGAANIQTLMADEMYAVAIALDPKLPHGPNPA